MGESRSTPSCSSTRSSPRPQSIFLFPLVITGLGKVLERERAQGRRGRRAGGEGHEQERGEWLRGLECEF
jgi:hypothetical protein